MLQISNLIKLDRKFILASQSPRRKKLLEQLGFEFDIQPAHIDENLDPTLDPKHYAEELAFRKAESIAGKQKQAAIVAGSDTIVVLDGEILNKPEDEEHAFQLLRKLSGRTHKVITGLSLIGVPENIKYTGHELTEVTFRELEDDEIRAYIATGSPMDKAGAYGIQDDFGAVFVSHINGCYYNIVGLPLQLLYVEMKKLLQNLDNNL